MIDFIVLNQGKFRYKNYSTLFTILIFINNSIQSENTGSIVLATYFGLELKYSFRVFMPENYTGMLIKNPNYKLFHRARRYQVLLLQFFWELLSQ